MARKPIDDGLSAHDIPSGRTDLHFTNGIIHEIAKLHTTIERDLRNRKEKKFTHMSKQVYYLHKKISK